MCWRNNSFASWVCILVANVDPDALQNIQNQLMEFISFSPLNKLLRFFLPVGMFEQNLFRFVLLNRKYLVEFGTICFYLKIAWLSSALFSRQLRKGHLPVLRIHEILVRIRIRGSIPLTNGLKKSQNIKNQCLSYYFCMMIGGSGSGRPKNIWILRIRIRIRNL